MIGVEVIGLKELEFDLQKYGIEGEKAIDKAIKITAIAIQTDAKERLRGGLGASNAHSMPKQNIKTKEQTGHGAGGLMGSIYNRSLGFMESVVGTAQKYAAYIEFGIGDYVFTSMDFDKEARAEAANYKGKKKVKGFPNDSFLNWAAVHQEKKLIERIEKNLNDLNK